MKSHRRPSNDPASPPRVIVVGGGLAGMAAAVALESAGVNVTLIEARKFLGGRAGSFEEPQTGEALDNCQHVLLGCCTNLLDFYRRIGVLNRITWERIVHFVDAKGTRHDLWGSQRLPAPLHLSRSMLGFKLLTLAERLAFTRAMVAMIAMGRSGRDHLADTSFGHWLDDHRQPASLVKKMYDPILVSALNEESRRASAAYAIQVFQETMLSNAAGYVIGLPNCHLSELYATLPVRDLRLGTRVASLRLSDSCVQGVEITTGEVFDADAVLLATNRHTLRRWIGDEWLAKDPRFAHLDKIEDVPILGAHLWFDRPVLAESHAALVEGPLQWLFRKDAQGAAVHGVISAARAWAGKPREDALEEFTYQIRATFPAARTAKLLRGVVVIEKRATFSPTPGIDRLRPAQAPGPKSSLGHLYLAGDYTRTGWPATMEGAVRSGYLAAGAIASHLLEGQHRFLVNDLPTQWPSRLLGL